MSIEEDKQFHLLLYRQMFLVDVGRKVGYMLSLGTLGSKGFGIDVGIGAQGHVPQDFSINKAVAPFIFRKCPLSFGKSPLELLSPHV